jgi:hypothetical protein
LTHFLGCSKVPTLFFKTKQFLEKPFAMSNRLLAVLGLAVSIGGLVHADEKVSLREQLRVGDTAVVRLAFRAEGTLLVPQSEQKDKAQSFTAQGQFEFEEKLLAPQIDSGGETIEARPAAAKSLRYYLVSSLESVVENNKVARQLREPVRLVVAETRGGRPFLFSPVAPLTVEEYELIDADASMDSLVIGSLLPSQPVALGESWRAASEAVAAVFNLTHIGNNQLQLRLEKLDESVATISLAGHVEGICSGTATLRSYSGQLIFDRKTSKIVQADVNHREERKAGPLGSALDVRASYQFRRNFSAPITQLNAEALNKVPTESNPATELVVYSQPDGRYRFYAERGWFVTMSHPQAAILRLLENGEFISECHVLAAPNAAPGSHMKPEEFRAQVQQALGKQFQQFVQEGEAPAPQGHWIYRVAAAGMVGGQPTVWIYHIIASPQGQQLVFIFRIHASQFDNFGVKDLALVGTVEFEPPKTAANQK